MLFSNVSRIWIGYNVLDWFMRDMTTKELIIMAGPNRPRHYEEEFKRQIVQLYENGKPSSQISAEYGIPRSTLQRWVQGIRNSGSTKAADNRTPEENELIELRKRNRQLEMEVDVSEQTAPVFCLCSISCCGLGVVTFCWTSLSVWSLVSVPDGFRRRARAGCVCP